MSTATTTTSAAPRAPRTLRLAEVPSGAQVTVCDTCDCGEHQALLHAMGLVDCCKLTVRQAGDPCIVEVNQVRMGLCQEMSRNIRVELDQD